MRLDTLDLMKKHLELLDIKFRSLTAVHTLLTTTLFSTSGKYNTHVNESVISLLEFEKKLKSDINDYIQQIQAQLSDCHDRRSRKCWPSYLREIPGGKKQLLDAD